MTAHRPRLPTLTRADLARAVQERVGVTGAQAGALVDRVFWTLADTLVGSDAGSVKITGFGTFYVRRKAERLGRNPRTREDALIRERRVLRFRCSRLLRGALNKEQR